jgi:uncharacterized protein YaaQ
MDPIISFDENNLLLIIVIQAQDLDNAQHVLSKLGLSSEQLPSVGGFLGLRNATLLVRIPENILQRAIDVLHESCRQRIEYIAVPLESAPLPLPTPTPVTVGGATIFGLEIEYFEEL